MEKKGRWSVFICVAALVVLLAVIAGCTSATKSKKVETKKETLKLDATERILIVAPHPDDESLAPAGLIQEALSKNIPVHVVMMTTGDGYKHATQLNLNVDNPQPEDYRTLAGIRRGETLAAMNILGLKDSDVTFLTFNDGSVNSLWNNNWDYDKLHLGLNGSLESPYDFAYDPKAPYCGQQVVKDLTKVISDFTPTTIVFPSAEDVHHDHWATNAFVQYVLANEAWDVKELQYLVHRGHGWPVPLKMDRKNELSIPPVLKPVEVTWIWKDLSTKEEDLKEKALKAYKSQQVVAIGFLDAFVRKNELFMRYEIPKLTRLDTAPALSSEELPGRILIDPNDDDWLTGLKKGGDLEALWLFRDKKKLWLVGDVRQNVSPKTIYVLHIRYIKMGDVDRLDAHTKGETIVVPLYASNSIKQTIDIEQDKATGRVAVKLPVDRLENSDYIMIDAETFDGQIDENHWIDRTAWQRVKIR